MKIKNIMLSIVAGLGLGLASCSSDDLEYQAASPVGHEQVYLSTESSDKFILSSSETSFIVPLNRIKSGADLNANIVLTSTNDNFQLESPTVKFNSGETIANIVINYDPEKLEYDVYDTLTVSIPDAAITSEYGLTSFTFVAGIPAPWVAIGKAKYHDDFLMEEGSYASVNIEQNELQPELYRLVNPYKNVTGGSADDPYLYLQLLKPGDVVKGVNITTEGLVNFYGTGTAASFNTGYHHETYDDDICLVFPAAFTSYNSEEGISHCYVKGYKEDGTPGQIILSCYYYMFNNGGWNYAEAEPIEIIFPGYEPKDYSFAMSFDGRLTQGEKDFAVFDITEFGKDLTEVKIAIAEGKTEEGAMALIEAGDESVQTVTSTGSVRFQLSTTGTYTALAVGYDAEGNVQVEESVTIKFQSSLDNSPKWKSLGMGLYTDDLLISMYTEDVTMIPTYEVEIQESEDTPGLYRLVNPYGAGYPYNDPGDYDDSQNYYLEINCVDPEGCYIEMQNMGVDWGDGEFIAYSFAAYYMDNGSDLATVKEKGSCGTLKDGVITFPANALLCTFAGDNNLYYGNTNSAFKVVLPSAVNAAAKKKVKKARYNKVARHGIKAKRADLMQLCTTKEKPVR